MSKVAVVYWTGSGNTAEMAEAVAEGAKGKGADVNLTEVSGFAAGDVAEYDAIALGCPAMGAEQLEEGEFEPFFEECKGSLAGKKVVLFGSYGWGDGEWMRSWEEECKEAGITLSYESVMANEAPDDDAKDACRGLGAALAL